MSDRVPSCVEFISVAAAQPRFGARRSEGELALWRGSSRHKLVSGGPVGIRTMMQPCASAARLRGGGPILQRGMRAIARPGSPPPRIVIASPPGNHGRAATRFGGPAAAEPAHAAGRRTTPSGVSPVVTKRHSAMSSLRANATIMVLRVPPERPQSGPVPGRQTAGLLEPEETPGELDHAAAHARVARLGEPLLRRLAPLSSGEPVRPA